MRNWWPNLRFAFVAGLLMLSGGLGLAEGFPELMGAVTTGQKIAAATQTIYGISAVLSLAALLRRSPWLRTVLIVWVIGIGLTGGLAPVVWGGASWSVGLISGAGSAAIAVLAAWAGLAHARPASAGRGSVRKFKEVVEIAAPVARVWEVMTDIERWHEWTPSVTSMTYVNGTFSEGSKVKGRQPKLPLAVWTITRIDRGTSFEWTSAAPGLRVVASHSLEATSGGTRATLEIEMRGPLGGFWGWLTTNITQRYMGLEARGLKARSENQAYTHS